MPGDSQCIDFMPLFSLLLLFLLVSPFLLLFLLLMLPSSHGVPSARDIKKQVSYPSLAKVGATASAARSAAGVVNEAQKGSRVHQSEVGGLLGGQARVVSCVLLPCVLSNPTPCSPHPCLFYLTPPPPQQQQEQERERQAGAS